MLLPKNVLHAVAILASIQFGVCIGGALASLMVHHYFQAAMSFVGAAWAIVFVVIAEKADKKA